MSLADVKRWIKAQRWLRPVMPLLKLGAWVVREVRSVPKITQQPRVWVKSKFYLRPLVPLFRWLERAVRSVLLPVRMVPFLYQLAWFRAVGRRRIRVPEGVTGPRRIVMLVCTNLPVDPRVRREALALAAGGFAVTIICPAWNCDPDECARLDWGPNITIRVLPMQAARFIYHYPYLYGGALLRAALAEDAWAYHAHDLDMSFIALLAAARKQVACVCDFHEWYSENVTYDPWTESYRPHHFFKRRLYQFMERLVIRHATRVVTVCRSIGDLLETTYRSPRPIAIIRNIPEISPLTREPSADLRQHLNIPNDKKIVLYQGGMGPSRNLEPVIEAMKYVPGAVLVIRGPGYEAYGLGYLLLADELGVGGRVHCLPPVPAARVVAEARAADVGLWTLLANVGLNFKLALPNKVFEYLAAGVPLLAADLPEVRALVAEYGVGACFDPDDPRSIAAGIRRFIADPGFLAECRANIITAMKDLRADQEWNKLVELYRQLGGAAEDAPRLARAG